MGQMLNRAGERWDRGSVGQENNGTEAQWDGGTLRLKRNGTGKNGTELSGAGEQWDRGVMGPGAWRDRPRRVLYKAVPRNDVRKFYLAVLTRYGVASPFDNVHEFLTILLRLTMLAKVLPSVLVSYSVVSPDGVHERQRACMYAKNPSNTFTTITCHPRLHFTPLCPHLQHGEQQDWRQLVPFPRGLAPLLVYLCESGTRQMKETVKGFSSPLSFFLSFSQHK